MYFLATLLATAVSGRQMEFHIGGQNSSSHPNIRVSSIEPDHIIFYGDHHENPGVKCDNLSSREIRNRISHHMDKVEGFLAENDWDSIRLVYPSIYSVYKSSPATLGAFIDNYRTAVKSLEVNDSPLSPEGLTNALRHASLIGLREIAHQHRPRRLSVENLRLLQADLVHVGVDSGLLQATMDLIDCARMDKLNTSSTESSAPANVGYDINVPQKYDPQSSGTLITSIDDLLNDQDIAAKFHPLGVPSSLEKLSDPYFPYQWYLGGPPEQPYGADFIRAWQLLTAHDDFHGLDNSAFPVNPITGELDMNVAIVDMGCGIHDDLVYDAANPICHEDDTKVGNIIDINDADVIALGELSVNEQKGEKIADNNQLKRFGASYCDYESAPHLLNEGHDVIRESYFHDPSNHGTSTASIIGAGWNDESGITGLCPFCSVKCIKISADDNNATQVNMAGIFRSLEFLAAFHDTYPISNHSYGGFFLDSKEVEGHRRLSQVGHMVVTAAGNYGCDIDPLAKAYGAFDALYDGIALNVIHQEFADESICENSKGVATAPMMPASVQFPTKIQVGATNLEGELSRFSNWGQQTVTLMAPGETIVSLRARNADEAASGNDEIIIQHGTSFSSPVATAAAALVQRRLEQMCIEPTAEKIIAALTSTVTKIDSLADRSVHAGTLNVYEALKSIENNCH